MINHVWGLLHHPDREWREISVEHESIGHLYLHHVFWMAAIPVVCSFIGTTQFGWSFDGTTTYKVSLADGLMLGAVFYLLILCAVSGVGGLIYSLARKIPNRPQFGECVIFAGYTATPLFLSGVFAIYPVFWLCLLAMIGGIIYTGFLLYRGTPNFLGVSNKRGFILSGVTLAAGVLILEFLLAVVVLLWSMGSEHSVVWQFFQ